MSSPNQKPNPDSVLTNPLDLLSGTAYDESEELDRAAVGVMHSYAPAMSGPIEPMGFARGYNQLRSQYQESSWQQPTKPPQKHASGARPAYSVEIQAPIQLKTEEGDVDCIDFNTFDMQWDITSQMGMEPEDDEIQMLEDHEYSCKTAVLTSRPADDALQAVAASTVQLEGSDREISYENEGFSVTVNFATGHTHCQTEITLLETGEDFTFPNHIAILYNKLSGDSRTFQRFYRESVNKLKGELSDLKPLNGKYLPTVDVMTDNFDRSDVPATSQATIDKSIESVLHFLRADKPSIESLREASATLLTLAQKHPVLVCKAASKNAALVKSLGFIFQNNHHDFEVAFNVSRAFNAFAEKETFYDGQFEVYRQIHESRIFDIVAESALWWSTQDGESKNYAKQLESSLSNFLNNVGIGYYAQGNKVGPNARSALLKIAGQTKTEFTKLQKTAAMLKSQLRL